MNGRSVLDLLGGACLMPIVTLERPEHAVPVAQALTDAGLPLAEITFRTAAAEEAIRQVATTVPHLLVGAGTVLTVPQAERAVDAGARFIVAPGFDARLVDWCIEHEITVFPGVATPSEITAAISKGVNTLKLFPAEELGGIRLLKALAGPFRGVRFVPTGGITAANLGDYLQLSNVVAVGGSWMTPPALISAGRFSDITRLAAEARQIVQGARRVDTEL